MLSKTNHDCLTVHYGVFYNLDLHQLKPADHLHRRRCVEWGLEQQAVDGNFSKKISFTDKAYFTLCGYVNKQYCRIWGFENPQVIEERPLYSEKVRVWCVLWRESVIEPYFFENDVGTIVTVNSVHYGHMITDFCFPRFWIIWLGENVVSTRRCHMPHNSSEYGFIAWDISWPRNFSLWRYQLAITIMQFDIIRPFFWGYAKDRIYANLEHLKTNIRQVTAETAPNMVKKWSKIISKESMTATLRVEVI